MMYICIPNANIQGTVIAMYSNLFSEKVRAAYLVTLTGESWTMGDKIFSLPFADFIKTPI